MFFFSRKNYWYFFIGILLVVIPLLSMFAKRVSSDSHITFWQIESIDTMKFSRDPSRDPNIYNKIPQIVGEVATLHPTHISIATPYDEEFYPVLRAWVSEARRHHLSVWFRGNFSGWEGWFGYPKITNPNQHNTLTKTFILNHPELFKDGDIFTPAPEPENGGIGDPRGSDSKTVAFNQFLVSSYTNCVNTFAQIEKQVTCGYFSTNGDIAKQVLTPQTVASVGNVIVIDHYVDSPEKMARDLDFLHSKFPQAKILLGEFGAPIPDINGNMTQQEQADFIMSLFDVFYQKRSFVTGLNYWLIQGGSTALVNDNGTLKPAANIVAKYYQPKIFTGKVLDPLNNDVENAQITLSDGSFIQNTGKDGVFSVALMPDKQTVVSIQKSGFKTAHVALVLSDKQNIQDIYLTPEKEDIFYKVKLFFKSFFAL